MLRQAMGVGMEGAHVGLALLGFVAALLAGAPLDVLLPFWGAGVALVAAGSASGAVVRRLRSRRASRVVR